MCFLRLFSLSLHHRFDVHGNKLLVKRTSAKPARICCFRPTAWKCTMANPISYWNCYDRFREEVPNINNSFERWHFRISESLTRTHQTMYKCTMLLKLTYQLTTFPVIMFYIFIHFNQQSKILIKNIRICVFVSKNVSRVWLFLVSNVSHGIDKSVPVSNEYGSPTRRPVK